MNYPDLNSPVERDIFYEVRKRGIDNVDFGKTAYELDIPTGRYYVDIYADEFKRFVKKRDCMKYFKYIERIDPYVDMGAVKYDVVIYKPHICIVEVDGARHSIPTGNRESDFLKLAEKILIDYVKMRAVQAEGYGYYRFNAFYNDREDIFAKMVRIQELQRVLFDNTYIPVSI